ncbi:MAG: cation:proton antiporter [Sorangiineae bacterium]|nr:cation:proton antiporter [Sorangiineae bacterium]
MLGHFFPALFPIRDPVLIFAIVLVLFLGSPIVMARLRLPGMIGLILAGAVLGPNALGMLARDASFELLGAVGLIYIMFTAALEVDLGAFRKHGVHSVVFGLLTFSVPQGVGTLMARYVLGFEWPPAILLASMFASHTLLAYPIVSKLGLSADQAVTSTLGGTMFTDVAALLVLAVIAKMTTGEVNEAFWWQLGVSLVVFVSAILLGLPRLGRRFFQRFPDDGPGQFVFVLTTVFLCAALSHVAGLEPIVGAFLAGLALNRLIPHASPLMNRLVFTGDAIFVPFFLLSVGMLVDARVLFGGLWTWAVAISMTVTAILTKWMAARLTRLVFRFSHAEGQVMFGLSVVQAAATLAAVMVGNRIGLFDDAVVNGTIVMILVTCILGPWVVAKYAPSMAKASAERGGEAAAPSGTLIPLATAEHAEAAVELALLLSAASERAPLYPAVVVEEGPDVAQRMADADAILAPAVAQASAAGRVAEPIKRLHPDPGRSLVRTRQELGAVNVVVPWDGAPSRAPSVGGADEVLAADASVVPSTAPPVLGRVVDELVRDAGANSFLCHLPQPLGVCGRVLWFLPPGVAGLPALPGAASVLGRLAKALGAPLEILCDAAERASVEAVARGASDGLELSPYPSPRAWLGALLERRSPTELFVLHGARELEPGASAEYEEFCRLAFGRLAERDVILFYPASPEVARALLLAAPAAALPAPPAAPAPA